MHSELTSGDAAFDAGLDGYRSLVATVEAGYDDCIYEYINDIDVRTIIQRILDDGYEPKAQAASELAELDARLARVLAPIPVPLRTTPGDRRVYFWWHGLPRNMSGELLQDALKNGYVTAGWPAAAAV